MKQTAGCFLCASLIRISRECKCVFFFQLKAKKMVSCAKRLKKIITCTTKTSMYTCNTRFFYLGLRESKYYWVSISIRNITTHHNHPCLCDMCMNLSVGKLT